jgi:hypothetical protein
MTFCVTYYYGDKNVESRFRDENHFAESISKIESIIIDDLRKGKSIEFQKTFWTEMLEDIDECWDEIEVGSIQMRNFQLGIVILKKLKVEFEREYGHFDTETFKLIHSEGFIDSKEFRKMYKKATGKNICRPCSICQVETTKKCSCCKKVYYCSPECQKCDWKSHRESIKKNLSI